MMAAGTSGGSRMLDLKRREFIALLGSAAAWPMAARGQQPSIPVIGFLNGQSPRTWAAMLEAFRKGLSGSGYDEGRNVAIEYRWAEGQPDRLPALAIDLVQRHVAVIVATGGSDPAIAAKAATSTIPIVFTSNDDPRKHGLVASLSRPGGNVTGVSWFSAELGPKRLALLRDLVPTAMTVAVLRNPKNAEQANQLAKLQEAARTLGLQLLVLSVTTPNEIDIAFATIVRERIGALVVAGDSFLWSRREQIAALAAHHAVPAIYGDRAGGLMSYGNSLLDAYRRAGIHTARILKGEKPADLAVDQATRFELVINLKIARTLGLKVPPTLLARADEVIE